MFSPNLSRRDLLRNAGIGSLALLGSRIPVMAGPFEDAEFEKLVPSDKKLNPEWVKSLFERGKPTIYRGDELKFIGMPIGGLCAGQLYLGGDGKLWHWDIFNQWSAGNWGGPHYAQPMVPTAPLEQGFGLVMDGKLHRLDATGFSDVSFQGQYPVGTVRYSDPAVPLAVTMEAFSPFIPLNVDDSSLPATMMRFTVKNTSAQTVEATLAGWLQNAVSLNNPLQIKARNNRVVASPLGTMLDLSAEAADALQNPQEDIIFEDWIAPEYTNWKVEGTAFGEGPISKKSVPSYQGDIGGDSERIVNSHATAPGETIEQKDNATGKITSREFVIDRNSISFFIGGGNKPGVAGLNVLVDGKVVRSATGKDSNKMSSQYLDMRGLRGKKATIEIYDLGTPGQPWSNIGVGRIVFTDKVQGNNSDFGTMSLMLMGSPATLAAPRVELNGLTGNNAAAATSDTDSKEALIGALGRGLRLKAGQSATVEFVISWHFPNLTLPEVAQKAGRYYATRFPSSAAVAQYAATNFSRLSGETLAWRDTWYDSTLPYWFLDRTFANASTLATSTAHRFADGRFWGWEGVNCCHGTCTHVWEYEQTMGRIFPELDINLRDRVDYGVAFYPDGKIGYRGENTHAAVDGQAGIILRTLRDHQMSPDDAFLKRNWPKIKKATEWMIAQDRQDGKENGIWSGAQPNTLDASWYGEVAWLTGMYLAGLRAGEELAREAGDLEFAKRCHMVREMGKQQFVPVMWNGEYFIQIADPAKKNTVGSYNGCEIDQVLGQSWGHQIGLRDVLPDKETKGALQALWKYNFTPDVGPYREKYTAGRQYALAGEGGLLMCTWPRGDAQRVTGSFDAYFNECMSGFEHQVAGHMIWEGMVQEGLAVERAIHDRYHAARRNPYNEVECSDHYARAMASYGVFLAACGFEYHGPKGHLAFAPKLTPENFKAPFTAAQGWGSYSQKADAKSMQAEVALRWGTLSLKTLGLTLEGAFAPKKVTLLVDGKAVPATMTRDGERVIVTLAKALTLKTDQKMTVKLV